MMDQKTSAKTALNRLQLIRSTVKFLNDIKQRGIDLGTDYSQNDLIYDKSRQTFGRIVVSNKYYFSASFNDELVTYFRKQDWKSGKEQFLIEHYMTLTNKDLAKVLHCSEKIIEKKLSKLNLKRNFEWDNQKDEFLLCNLDKSYQWLADKLNTSVSSIKGRIYRLKAKGSLDPAVKKETHTWTAEEDRFILANLNKSNQWFADFFQLKLSCIKSRLRKLRENGLISEQRKRGKKRKNI